MTSPYFFSLCLTSANPPFKGSLDYDTVSADLLKVCKTKKTELLFLALFLRMLKTGGRAAVIVPDGVLFGSSTAHKAIRKELVDNNRLEAVISMPSGVFKPYAGVSTGVLIFTKTGYGGTDNVWFYDMTADGFSLDDKRTPIADNDIPDIITMFHSLTLSVSHTLDSSPKGGADGSPLKENCHGEASSPLASPFKERCLSAAETERSYNEAANPRTAKSFLVPKDEIVGNDYDLSINKYKKTEYKPVEYPSTQELMADIYELEMEIGKALEELEEML